MLIQHSAFLWEYRRMQSRKSGTTQPKTSRYNLPALRVQIPQVLHQFDTLYLLIQGLLNSATTILSSQVGWRAHRSTHACIQYSWHDKETFIKRRSTFKFLGACTSSSVRVVHVIFFKCLIRAWAVSSRNGTPFASFPIHQTRHIGCMSALKGPYFASFASSSMCAVWLYGCLVVFRSAFG